MLIVHHLNLPRWRMSCSVLQTDLEHLDGSSSSEDLDEGEPDKHLTHGALCHGSVVELGELHISGEHGGNARELVNILNDAAKGGKHSHPAMLELGLTKPAGLFEHSTRLHRKKSLSRRSISRIVMSSHTSCYTELSVFHSLLSREE